MLHWFTRGLCCLLLVPALGLATPANTDSADPTDGDPMGSMQWPALKKEYLRSGPVVFDERVSVSGPQFAEDAQSVPLQIDAQALVAAGFSVQRMVVLVDRNPIRQVVDFEPLQSQPRLTLRFKLEQSSPVRLAVLDGAGVWHVNSALINATGGGCTVSGESRRNGSWVQTLNQVQTRFFPAIAGLFASRLRLLVMHPMDTGLVAGVPPLYLETLELSDAGDQALWRLHLHEPVAENPIFSFDFTRAPHGPLHLRGRDNNGNRIDQGVAL